ncbi:FkbM family methyltransferase [Aestuariivita boseongensis]|uniref:FkbM family methyltransferase n=1 Tax=Aestuariivita boseongensis TaxID=1470562 RepID=UPI00067FC3ED|nr:FkbM family methyltransferase [Aestuariivita boseongensis]
MSDLLPILSHNLSLSGENRIEIVDVGASDVDPSERPVYDPLLEVGLARLTGFEPNPDEFSKLPQTDQRRYLQTAIGDGRDQRLNLTMHPGFTSTLNPNAPVAATIANFKRLMRVTGHLDIATTRLDDIPEIGRMDFLKIDIQGGECLAFSGAPNLLRDCLCVHTETAFVQLYEGQPLFGDQHRMMVDAGLMFLGFHKVNKHPLRGMFRKLSTQAKARDIGAWIDADAVFIRDVRYWPDLEDAALTRLFVILAIAYEAASAAMHALSILESRKSVDPPFVQRCLEHFNADS